MTKRFTRRQLEAFWEDSTSLPANAGDLAPAIITEALEGGGNGRTAVRPDVTLALQAIISDIEGFADAILEASGEEE